VPRQNTPDRFYLRAQGLTERLGSASISTFDREVDVDKLVERWEDMSRRFPSYRRRPAGLHRRFHTAILRDYDEYNIRDHFTVETMPDGANGKRELEDHMAEFVAREWDLKKVGQSRRLCSTMVPTDNPEGIMGSQSLA
jgi:hypothetical protein